ncbi:MAG: Uma2 family endonuclease [Chitinophagaceae bacterium]|nr:Uma2 family endonuclease [Chitinophagaceae bacterium]
MKSFIRITETPATALDVYRMLPEGTRAEVLFNTLYMSPSPKFEHQKLVSKLFNQLYNHVEKTNNGIVICSPFDVYLEEQMSAVQPDILFISHQNMNILKEDGYAHGTPDLIIEVVSGKDTRDRTLKKKLYEKAGLKEYFIVETKSCMAELFVLSQKKYRKSYSRKGLFRSRLLGLEFRF